MKQVVCNTKKQEEGYILLGAIILVAIAAIIMAGTLDLGVSSARTIKAAQTRTEEFYKSEETMGSAISWLRSNSQNLVSIFSRNNFYGTFDRGNFTVGTNDNSGKFTVATRIKLQGTNNSAILANNSTLATGAFPTTTNPSTGATFNANTSFSTGSYGDNKVRITLVDAVPIDSSKDYGDTDAGNSAPDTDFNPVYRVDSMKETDRGAHVFGYLMGSLVFDYGVGFYGRDSVYINQPCDSYLSNNGSYSSTSKRANCPVGSNGTVGLHQQLDGSGAHGAVYGTVRTNGSITNSSPYGAVPCSDFQSGCPNHGTTCADVSCSVPDLPTYQAWASYCPQNQGNLTINNNVNYTLTVAGNNANQKCWNTITTKSGSTLRLTTTQYPYFINTFNIANNSTVDFQPSPNTGTINLYVNSFTGNKFNGNQVFNINNKPYQLRIHYLGTADLVIDGGAQMKAFIVAPNAGVTYSGTADFFGGIKAENLTISGSANVHYDESGDITTISDVEYTARNIEEYYR